MSLEIGGTPITVAQRGVFRNDLSVYYPGAEMPVALISDGDSKGAESMEAMKWASTDAPWLWDWVADIKVGSSGSSNVETPVAGLTSPSRLAAMASAISSAKSAGYLAVDVMLTIGTNDSALTAEQTIANVKLYYDAFVAAGGRLLWLWGVDPSTTSGTTARTPSINAGYADMARNRSQLVFVSTERYMLDPAATNFTPLGQATNTVGSVTYDGLHASVYGWLQKGRAIAPILNRAFRVRDHFDCLTSGSPWGANFPRGNILGAEARFRALGGTDTSTGGTVTGTPPLGWAMSGELAGMSVAFTAESNAAVASALNLPANLPLVRMAVSGTPTADVAITFARTVTASGAITAGRYEHEMLAYADNLVGLVGIRYRGGNMTSLPASGGSAPQVSLGDNDGAGIRNADSLPAMTRLLYGRVGGNNVATPGGMTGNLIVNFRSGIAASGSLLLIGACSRRATEIAA
jgi:hypothetical protein